MEHGDNPILAKIKEIKRLANAAYELNTSEEQEIDFQKPQVLSKEM